MPTCIHPVLFRGVAWEDDRELSLRFMQTYGYALIEAYDEAITFFVCKHVPDGWGDLVAQLEPGRSNSPSQRTSRSLTQVARRVLRKRALAQGKKSKAKRPRA